MPHSMNDQFRRRFSLYRPFEGGFEATSGIFVAIYYHLLIPGNELKVTVSIQSISIEAKLCKLKTFLSIALAGFELGTLEH